MGLSGQAYGASCMCAFYNLVVQNSQVGFATESIRHFVNCVWNATEPLVGGVDGLRASEILVAAEKSAATGQPVRLVHSQV